jgi:alpha-ribazole phosphatase
VGDLTKIILIRHGETEWNKNSRCMGHTNIELSPEGERQAHALAKRMKGMKLSAIYASDLDRAFRTAEIIAREHGLTVQKKELLRELNFGEWEGLTYAQVEEKDRQRLQAWMKDIANAAPPGGEAFSNLKERALAALQEIVQVHPEETVAVVSHGGTIKTILCSIVDAPLRHNWRFQQDNGAINILEFYEDGAVICSVNDTCHLREELYQ